MQRQQHQNRPLASLEACGPRLRFEPRLRVSGRNVRLVAADEMDPLVDLATASAEDEE